MSPAAWHDRLPPTPVAVLLGGPSAEHDVSVVSGLAVARALAERGHPVQAWVIGLDGRWWELPRTIMDDPPHALAFDEPRHSCASSRQPISPLAITGMPTAWATGAIAFQSACPL